MHARAVAPREPGPWELGGVTPKQTYPGTQRARAPRETLERMAPFLGELGITRVAVVTGLDHIGIPTVSVTRPNSRCVSVVQGKGAELDAAKASGVMEAVEHHHAERVLQPVLLARWSELRGSRPVADVERLPGFVRRLDPHERIHWIEGTELRSNERLWVPYDLVHLDFTLPLPSGSGCFPLGTGGLASGNHPLEAACHAIYELVERDAVTLFYQRAPEQQWRRRVALESVDDPLVRDLLERYARARVAVAVWEVTSDVPLPCFLCSIVDRELDPFRALGAASGAGCHADRNIALSRALTEAAQCRLTRIVGARDDLSAEQLDATRSREAHARSLAQLGPSPFPERQLADAPSWQAASFEGDLEHAYAALGRAGLQQIIGVDLSLPRYPVHVVRMIIPGLEGFSEVPGYRPGARAQRLRAEPAGEGRA